MEVYRHLFILTLKQNRKLSHIFGKRFCRSSSKKFISFPLLLLTSHTHTFRNTYRNLQKKAQRQTKSKHRIKQRVVLRFPSKDVDRGLYIKQKMLSNPVVCHYLRRDYKLR